MKKSLLLSLGLVVLVVGICPGLRGQATDAETDYKAIVQKVQDKVKAGKTTEQDLADELKEFDALIERHKSEKTDTVAQMIYMQAMLYNQVLDNPEKATALVERIKKDYPETKLGQNADKILESYARQEEQKKIQRSLAEGTKFPDFDEKDVAGKPLSIANYKGKVVLLDFWATWCGPCVQELPNVLSAYDKYHSKGFEIIGISLDKDEAKLTSFITDKKMTWQQFFDGKFWSNKLAVRYGVNSIPATYLLDGEGKIIGKNLRGERLDEAVSKALAKN